jgi:uncharacterized protein YigE (DUF2233 family)
MRRPPRSRAGPPGAHLRAAARGACWLLLLALLAGCGGPDAGRPQGSAPAPTLMPTPTGPPPPTPAPAAPPADTGWRQAAPGVELRRLSVSVGGKDAPVTVARLDPALVRIEVGYAPDRPLPLATWAGNTGALAAINGGFFDADGRTVALLVHAGRAFGESYQGRGGMFAVTPEGAVWLRGLADAPYDPAEPVAEGLQGWPLLVRPGGEAAFPSDDGARERRSALAVDEAGRVLLVAAPTAAFTLSELAAWLAGSDLAVAAAVNLDGGGSTGLIVRSEAAPERIDPFTPLPIVLLALPR